MTCPPTRPFAPQRYDMRSAKTCVEACRTLYAAYARVISGDRTIEVRFNERWTTYDKADAKGLLELYRMQYNQCPAARAAGLPNLNPGNVSQRGAPARGYWNFPRM